MATKKKSKGKQAKARSAAGKKKAAAKKVVKSKSPQRVAAKKKTAPKPASGQKKRVSKKKTVRANSRTTPGKQAQAKGRRDNISEFPRGRRTLSAGGQSGDLQGLSNVEGANSESVDELIEEGNAFEADVVMGVEDAGNSEGREVHTHEVPEDDVPEEYLDNEK
jgi:hypothetical protein